MLLKIFLAKWRLKINTRSGFIFLVGPPNAGKSTLINKLLGQKISIVSKKVQTTRFTTRGILNIDNSKNDKPDCQIIFVDTPGLFKPKKALEKHIVKNTVSELNSQDHILVLFDASSGKKKINDFREILNELRLHKKSCSLIINKIDLIKKENLLLITENILKIFDFQNVFMISAKNGHGCKDLVKFLETQIPFGKFLYDKDQVSNVSEKIFSAEITREKLFNFLNSELPYNLYVETIMWKETSKFITIHQNINVSKYNHKLIIIGKNGDNLKKIGIKSRINLEKILGKKINLFIFVKIKNNWMNNIKEINHLGVH